MSEPLADRVIRKIGEAAETKGEGARQSQNRAGVKTTDGHR